MSKKILVIDDNEQDRQIVKRYFSRSEYDDIHMAEDGDVGLERARQLKPDLIILDVLMPRMNGFEVLKELKNDPDYSHIPVIMLTVKSEAESLDQGIALGADFYLPKPFTRENLLEFVELILG